MIPQTEQVARNRFFTLERPESDPRPVLIEIPHAGLAIPEEVASEMRAPRDGILRDADIYVDKLFAGATRHGATMLAALTSRYVVDLNRAPHDVDLQTVPDHPAPRGVQPRGVVWRMTTDGRSLLRRPLSYAQLQRRLARFHAPYHNTLKNELARMRKRWGFAICLAAHSMPSVGRALGSDRASRRPDVVPGSRGRTSADPRLIDLIGEHFREAGLSVKHDDPYRGGYTTGHYGKPKDGVHVVQIELNRALYVHESTCEPKPELEQLRNVLDALVRRVVQLDLS